MRLSDRSYPESGAELGFHPKFLGLPAADAFQMFVRKRLLRSCFFR